MRPLAEIAAAAVARYGHIRHKRNALRLGGIALPSKGAARELIQAVKAAAPLDRQLPHGCRGFWIITERPPPELISFSYIRCFAGDDTPASKPQKRLNQAARATFTPGMLCPRDCGTALTADNAHVDHVEPKFRDIVTAFVTTYGWRFANPADAEFFAQFHDTMAERAR